MSDGPSCHYKKRHSGIGSGAFVLGVGGGYFCCAGDLGDRMARLGLTTGASGGGSGSFSSSLEAKKRTPSWCSPMTCRRRKFVDPDLVRVPATMAMTSRGRT